MKIAHIAIWVKNLEMMKEFYCTYFHTQASTKYENPITQFSSYFLSFEQGAPIEIMHKAGIEVSMPSIALGWAHLSISVGSREKVDALTNLLREKGYTITGNPRTTGDGYYESTILDPEGNLLEITV
jgi:lactoylglutathione lyase